MVRNGTSTKLSRETQRTALKTTETKQLLLLLFSVKFGCYLDIFTMQDKHNIHVCTLSVKLNLFALAAKPARKVYQ